MATAKRASERRSRTLAQQAKSYEVAGEYDYDWEEVDSCWGYYCDKDELIKEVIEEHQLQPSVAA